MTTYKDCTDCFANRTTQSVIDIIDPTTGRGFYGNRSIDEIRRECPNVEVMSLNDFAAWKAEQQRTPIKWIETTEAEYHDMLNCLPPAAFEGSAFLVGEPYDHDAGNGRPRFTAYRRDDHDNYLVSSRPMTIKEFRDRP